MQTQADKAQTFQALHHRPEAFIIPNPWDPGTARLLEGVGFEALATTSAGFAFSRGKRDNRVGREAMIGHVAEIVAATDLPVSADLENGFGDEPETAAETIRMGAAVGLVGDRSRTRSTGWGSRACMTSRWRWSGCGRRRRRRTRGRLRSR